jgi:predicted DCC family thiol-disulfide oxidoreductase YuxK
MRSSVHATRALVPNPPGMPLVVFDGDCAFCRLWVERWRCRLGERVGWAPYQETSQRFPSLPVERFRRAVQLIEPDGNVYEGAEAVFRTLAKQPGHGHWLATYRRLPGARTLFDAGYHWVAGHRNFLYPATRRLLGDPRRPAGPGRSRPRWLPLGVGLGALALGTAGLVLWRRKRRAAGR